MKKVLLEFGIIIALIGPVWVEFANSENPFTVSRSRGSCLIKLDVEWCLYYREKLCSFGQDVLGYPIKKCQSLLVKHWIVIACAVSCCLLP